nr:M61 family metallopeptidase [candidate division KSB1 bacterium]NIR73058.1 M61 family metallopeptidase [candidate division KSB1 bacterium]NIS28381.1 M61 family metallopeptidase [candidate division KSB1 bacterium]NIT75262.1 M61 family metallopeptidase [candidate division KSB1 bacterium]NIU24478.1 M61 family metallopeptidase [candidate division KSB1 bacterium]
MRWTTLWIVLVTISQSLAQAPVEYQISFENADHHEAEVEVRFAELPDSTLEVRMSRTSPGRYALHEFAKNVYNVQAVDSKGRALTVTRPNPHQWNVRGHDGTVQITYTIFGDQCDGTYLAIDNTHAHMNMPATFMWARGLEDRPIEITFRKPDPDWKIATQLVPTDNEQTFTAPNLAYFMDSPTEISDFQLRQWEINTDGTTKTIRLALHHDGTEAEADAFAQMCQAVVAEEIAIFEEAPQFDYGTYTFIADYLPYVDGDGMEHRNSTILTSTRSLKEHAVRNLGTVAHEFFHAWNVERMRPRSLEPFDFERANMSGELWFAEGFTSYYDGLILRRARLINIDRYAEELSRTLNTVLNAPGRQFFSPVEMSQKAPFTDAATSVDPKNFENTFLSYYRFGAGIGLGLDLTLRQRFAGVTLDDVMRATWNEHGKSETPYTNNNLRRILGEVTGDRDFADEFFQKYIYGREL